MSSDGWFKSARSKETADCVEVRLADDVGIRDTKDRDGGQLAIANRSWTAFVSALTNQ
nr:DUF397 domain-containing protein [Amycolatopsis sp.]